MPHFIRHSDGIIRSCSRCRRELTDAASREAGIGPICRLKNNDLFARQIPANVNTASALFLSLQRSDFHESVEGFAEIKDDFVSKICSLQVNNDNLSAVTLQGGDFRHIVDWFDYSLSFPGSRSVRKTLIEIIDALGYVGLASVLRGDACMSKAVLLIDGSFITLSGKSCKAGWLAMKANVPGVQTPRYRGDSTPYKASVQHAEKFIEVAVRHWPFIEDNVEEVLEDAKKAAENLPEPMTSDPRPLAVFGHTNSRNARRASDFFAVVTPWTGTANEMHAMLDQFRAIPSVDRYYDPSQRCWQFHAKWFRNIASTVNARYRCEWRGPSVVHNHEALSHGLTRLAS